MRKLVLAAVLLASGTALFAQNLDAVQEKISQNKYAEAKERIDKVLADAKGQKSANAWYYKAVIYNALSKDTTQDNSAYRTEAFNAYVKSQELDPKNVMGTLEQNVTLFDLHGQFINAGIKNHNTKNYQAALANYKGAIEAQEYINKKGFTYNNQALPALDTFVNLYAGSAAFLLKDTATGVQYFSKLADAKVGGKEFLEVHQFLVDYYSKRGDMANADKYTAIGKELYPDNEYWVYYTLQDPELRQDKAKMLAKFEEVIAKNPENKGLVLDYAIELFNYTYGENKPADYKATQAKLDQAINRAIEANNTAEANFLMVQNLSNQIYDMQESMRAIKGTKPEDEKRRKAINTEIDKKYDLSAKYAETAAQQFSERSELKAVEKANYKSVLNTLTNYYKTKKQLDKAKTYEDKAKSLS
jgi:hypothetical protein